MQEVEIKLSKEQYLALAKILFFADFLNFCGYVTYPERVAGRSGMSDLLEKIYKQSDQLKIAKDIHLLSRVPFTNEEYEVYTNFIKDDLKNISRIFLAKEFAKHELKSKDQLLDENMPEMKQIINGVSKKYLKEFKKNGISNLRFKMFYKVAEDEAEDED